MKDLQLWFHRTFCETCTAEPHMPVVVVFLHMLRVFYTGSYRSPKEFNWVIGLSSGLDDPELHGYLLPGSTRSENFCNRNEHGALDAVRHRGDIVSAAGREYRARTAYSSTSFTVSSSLWQR
jgi:hypothetical protein